MPLKHLLILRNYSLMPLKHLLILRRLAQQGLEGRTYRVQR
jgi:hypothetical protein